MKINEDLLPVIVSSTEPTGSYRKKVWKRHTKNLLNLQPFDLMTNNSGEIVTIPGSWDVILDVRNISSIYVSGNFSLLGDSVLRVGKFSSYPALGLTGIRSGLTASSSISTIGTNYLLLTFLNNSSISNWLNSVKNSFMINEGSTPLTYEPYVEDEDFILSDLGNYESMSDWTLEPAYNNKVLKDGYIDSSAIHHQGNGVTDILSFLKDFSTLLSCFTNAKWVGTGGAADVDTDIPVNKSSGGGLVLAFHTWHSSAGANTRIQIDAIRLGYSGDNVKVNNILTEGAGSGSVGYSINDSKNLHYKLTGTNGMIKSKLICLG